MKSEVFVHQWYLGVSLTRIVYSRMRRSETSLTACRTGLALSYMPRWFLTVIDWSMIAAIVAHLLLR